jgi:hypothetical protein
MFSSLCYYILQDIYIDNSAFSVLPSRHFLYFSEADCLILITNPIVLENTDRILHTTQRLDEAFRGLLDTVYFPVATFDNYQSGVQLKALPDGHFHIELLAEHFDHGAVDVWQRLGRVDHRQLKAEVERHQTLQTNSWVCTFALKIYKQFISKNDIP